MLPRIDASEVVGRVTKAFKDHNAGCPIVSHTRNTARGRIIVERRKGIVNEAVTTTFHAILTAYIHNYNAVCEMLPAEFQDISKLPALRTNSVKVGKFAHCSDRTVRNHLGRLKNFGIVSTKNHGSKQDFELWISANFLFGEESIENPQNAPKNALFTPERKNFPVYYSHLEKKINNKTAFDDNFNKVMGEEPIDLKYGEEYHREGVKTDSLPGVNAGGLNPQRSEEVPPAGWLTRVQKIAQRDQERREKATAMLNRKIAEHEAKKPKLPLGLDPKFAMRLVEFWLYAMRVIYPTRNFNKEQQEKALVAISKGVYGDFQDIKTERKWSDFHAYQMQKLDKVAKYLSRYPSKYAANPFSPSLGKGYFDASNKNGFAGVDEWMDADQIRKAYKTKAALIAKKEKLEAADARLELARQKEIKCDQLLKTARMDFEKLARSLRPRVEVENLTTKISLYNFWDCRMAAHGNHWREKLYNQYIEQEARNFKPPMYRKQRLQRLAAGEVTKETIIYVEDYMHYGEGFYS